MFRHLFKLIWNKKKQNSLLIVEMLVSFMVIFAVSTSVVYYYRNYMKPMGMAYQDVWLVNYNNPVNFTNSDSMVLYFETLRQSMKGLRGVRGMSFISGNTPFSQSTNGTGLMFGNKKINRVDVYDVEDGYKAVLEANLLEGRWLEKQDATGKNRHIVINEALKELTFGKERAVGKLIGSFDDKNKYEVVGVVQDIKDKGDYSRPRPSIYQRLDTAAFH